MVTETQINIEGFINTQRDRYGESFYLKQIPTLDGIKLVVLTKRIRIALQNYLGIQEEIFCSSLEEDEGEERVITKGDINLQTAKDERPEFLADQLSTGERIRILEPVNNHWTPVLVHHDFESQAPNELGWIIYDDSKIAKKIPDHTAVVTLNSVLSQFIKHRPSYRLSGKSFELGFDCSGFTQTVIRNLSSLTLPRLARWQALAGFEVPLPEVRTGDLIYFRKHSGAISHVGLVIDQSANNSLTIAHFSSNFSGLRIEGLNNTSWLNKELTLGGFKRIM